MLVLTFGTAIELKEWRIPFKPGTFRKLGLTDLFVFLGDNVPLVGEVWVVWLVVHNLTHITSSHQLSPSPSENQHFQKYFYLTNNIFRYLNIKYSIKRLSHQVYCSVKCKESSSMSDEEQHWAGTNQSLSQWNWNVFSPRDSLAAMEVRLLEF